MVRKHIPAHLQVLFKESRKKSQYSYFKYSPNQKKSMLAALRKAGVRDTKKLALAFRWTTQFANMMLCEKAESDVRGRGYVSNIRKELLELSQTLEGVFKALGGLRWHSVVRLCDWFHYSERSKVKIRRRVRNRRLPDDKAFPAESELRLYPENLLWYFGEKIYPLYEGTMAELAKLREKPSRRGRPENLQLNGFASLVCGVFAEATGQDPKRGTYYDYAHNIEDNYTPSPFHDFLSAAVQPTGFLSPTTKTDDLVRRTIKHWYKKNPLGKSPRELNLLVPLF